MPPCSRRCTRARREGRTPHPPPRFWIGSTTSWASRTGLGEAGVLLSSEAVASSAAKDVDDARLWLRLGRDIPADGGCVDVVVGRCGAVRGIGDTVAHLHPQTGVEAHSSAPPTRPYVDIDGADATLCALPLQLWQGVRWQDL